MAKSPSQIVKDKFGDKNKLVDAVKQFVNDDLWVGRENKDKGLARVSNSKLLRLLETFTTVQSKWGTRGKLIDAVVEAAGRGKDAGYRKSIEAWPVPRLYDQFRSLTARIKAKTDKAAPKAAKKEGAAAPKKAAAPAKKPAASASKAPAKKDAAKKGATGAQKAGKK